MPRRIVTRGIVAAVLALAPAMVVSPVAAAGPVASLSATSLNFGSVSWQQASPTQVVTVTNTGDASIVFSTTDVTGQPYVPEDFMVPLEGCSFRTLAPGASCQTQVYFRPQSGGPRSATLLLYDNAPGSPQQVALAGTGTGPVIMFTPRSLDFGVVQAGTTSSPLTFSMVNAGDSSATISKVALGPAPWYSTWFAITQDSCSGATLGPGQRCTISADITPAAVTSAAQIVQFTDNAGTGQQSFSLYASGGGPLAGILNGLPDFNNVPVGTTSATARLQVFAAGTQPLQISGVAFDNPAAGFNIVNDGCSGTTLPVGAPSTTPPTCNLDVTFTPPATGQSTANLVFQDNELGGTHSQTLNGRGYAPAGIPSPAAVDFGFVATGTASASQIVTLSNPTPLPLTVSSVTLGGNNPSVFALTSNSCSGTSVAPGGSCSVGVALNAPLPYLFSATLSFSDNSASSPPVPQTVSLRGEGASPTFTVSTSDLNLGNVKANVASGQQTITVTNTTAAAASFGFLPGAGLTPSGCTGSIAAGASCTLSVSVNSPELGAQSSLLKVFDASFNQQVVEVDWTGNTGSVFIEGPLAFASIVQQAGTSLSVDALIRNGGTASLNLGQISLSNNPPASITNDLCSNQTIAPGTNCRITLTSTPPVVESWYTTLTVPNDSVLSPNPTTLFIRGLAGPAAQPVFSPSAVTFPAQHVGAPETTQIVWLDNGLIPVGGAQPLTISSVAIGGPDATAFRVVWDGCSGLSIDSAYSCPVAVGFDPTAGRSFNASLLFNDDAAGSPQSIQVSGVGLASGASLSSTQLAFGVVPAGQQSQSQTVTVTNSGNLSLNISSINTAAPFTTTGGTCLGNPVAVGASCAITVAFAPTTRGTFNGSLTISDDAPASPQTIGLSGQGVVRQLSVTPTTLDLGRQPVGSANPTTQLPVTVTNTGPDPVDLTGFTLSTGFAFGSATCVSGVLAPGASCTIGIYATPSAVGPETGQLTINDDAGGAPQTVALSAVGTGGIGTVTPASVDFGNVLTFTKSAPVTVTITNTGNTAFTISRVTISGTYKGDYTITSENCQNQTLSPGASCTDVIVFRPQGSGSRPATLTYTDFAVNGPQSVPLTGTGISK